MPSGFHILLGLFTLGIGLWTFKNPHKQAMRELRPRVKGDVSPEDVSDAHIRRLRVFGAVAVVLGLFILLFGLVS